MLVCAIMIKHRFQNSTLYDTRITSIMRFFGVSHKKAGKLLKRFSQSELFIFHPDGKLFAKTFKSREKVVYGKGKRKYEAFADYCCKMQMQDINLRDAVRELRNILITCAIDFRERGDNLNIVGRTKNVEHPRSSKSKAVTHKLLGSISGLSRSSAGRYINRLMDDDRVSKTRIVAECVIPELNDSSEREWRRQHPNKGFFAWHSIEYGNWSGWQHHGTIYSLCRRKDSECFRHVIYNYRRKNMKTEPVSSAELDGKWQD